MRAFIIVTLCLVAPLLLPGGPPLVDYPNHLARMKVAFEPDAFTEAFYDFHWILVGNLGLEAVVWALTFVLPVEAATECSVAIAIILPAIGLAWLSQSLHGRLTVPCLVGLVFLWNGVLQYGFLSFSLGIGLAFCAFAFWVATEKRALLPRTAVGALLCVAMFFAHLLAFVFYGLALAGYMIGRIFWRRDQSLGQRIGGAVLAGMLALPTLTLMTWANRGGGVSHPAFSSARTKIKNLEYMLYESWAVVLAATLMLCAVLFIGAVARYRWPFPAPIVGPIVAVTCGYLAMPVMLGHGPSVAWGVDWRMLPFLGWLCCAGLRDPFAARQATWPVVAASSFVLLTLAAMVQKHWLGWVRTEAELRACIGRLEPGQSLISFFWPVSEETERQVYAPPAMFHAASWAVTDRSAYIPSLFAYRFQHPLRYDVPRRALAEEYPSALLPVDSLIDPQTVAQFDYVLGLFELSDRSIPPNIAGSLGPVLCEGDRFKLFPVVAARAPETAPIPVP